MPYLQLDVNGRHAVHNKRQLAQRLSETYARLMSVDICRVSVAIRESGEGSLWRIVDGEPVPVSVLMCDIRRGRSAEQRMEVARALSHDCCEVLGLHEDRLNVEFTQHAGDEMYHPTLGGFSPEWSEEEVGATVEAAWAFTGDSRRAQDTATGIDAMLAPAECLPSSNCKDENNS